MRLTTLLLSSLLPSLLAQPPAPQRRDLKIETVDSTAPSLFTIPRSYALIVGISNYKNLSPDQQLRYAERDAQAMFTILISPEGGNFKVENVHVLTNEK